MLPMLMVPVFGPTGKPRFKNGLPSFCKTTCCITPACACLPDSIPTYLYATIAGFHGTLETGTCCSRNNGVRGPMLLEEGPDGCARWVRESVNDACQSNTQILTGWWEPHPTDPTQARFLIHTFQSGSAISVELNCLWGSPYVTIPVNCCETLLELEFAVINSIDHELGWNGRCGSGPDPTVFISEVGGCCKQDPINYPEENIVCCCGFRPLPLWPLAENALPSQLTLSVVSSTGCPCAASAFDGKTLEWGGADWFVDGTGFVENCDARGYRVIFLCDNIRPGVFSLTLDEPPGGGGCGQLTGVLQPGATCDPVNATFEVTFPGGVDCCDGVGGVVVFNVSEATPLMALGGLKIKPRLTINSLGYPNQPQPRSRKEDPKTELEGESLESGDGTNPGSDLHGYLADKGFEVSEDCSCNSMIRTMDKLGVAWSKVNIHRIVAVMVREAVNRKFKILGVTPPQKFMAVVAKRWVLQSLRNTTKKAEQQPQ